MTELDLKHARESVATPEFEALLGEPPALGRTLEPAGLAHLVLRGVKLHLLTLADEVERLQVRVAELEALAAGQQDVIWDLQRANLELNDACSKQQQKLTALRRHREALEGLPEGATG